MLRVHIYVNTLIRLNCKRPRLLNTHEIEQKIIMKGDAALNLSIKTFACGFACCP